MRVSSMLILVMSPSCRKPWQLLDRFLLQLMPVILHFSCTAVVSVMHGFCTLFIGGWCVLVSNYWFRSRLSFKTLNFLEIPSCDSCCFTSACFIFTRFWMDAWTWGQSCGLWEGCAPLPFIIHLTEHGCCDCYRKWLSNWWYFWCCLASISCLDPWINSSVRVALPRSALQLCIASVSTNRKGREIFFRVVNCRGYLLSEGLTLVNRRKWGILPQYCL